jgi:excisionase family DNA binding protein
VLNALPFLRIWQAAVLMGVSESHLRDLISREVVPVKRWGKSVRVARRDLDAITGT